MVLKSVLKLFYIFSPYFVMIIFTLHNVSGVILFKDYNKSQK